MANKIGKLEKILFFDIKHVVLQDFMLNSLYFGGGDVYLALYSQSFSELKSLGLIL